MSICIKRQVDTWLNQHPKMRQWLWFAVLWVSGLLAVLLLAYPFKWLIKGLG